MKKIILFVIVSLALVSCIAGTKGNYDHSVYGSTSFAQHT